MMYRSIALVDAENGQLKIAKLLPGYLRTLEVSRPLHFGDYGGILLRFFRALFDLALILVLISGLYLWLSRRRAPIEKEVDQWQGKRAGKIEVPLRARRGRVGLVSPRN